MTPYASIALFVVGLLLPFRKDKSVYATFSLGYIIAVTFTASDALPENFWYATVVYLLYSLVSFIKSSS